MVEYKTNLDAVFASLADATRRDILKRVVTRPRSIKELAAAHKHMSFAAVAKHVAVMERSRLVVKKREGRLQLVSANPEVLSAATDALAQYQAMWDARFDALDTLLENETTPHEDKIHRQRRKPSAHRRT